MTPPSFKHVPHGFAPPGYITSEECARRRGVSDETLRSERCRGRSPIPWSKYLGVRPIYRERDLADYQKREAEKAQARATELLRRAAESESAP